jgi:MFS family permease
MDETAKKWQANVFVLYLLGFLFSLHVALPAYINSTFLSRFVTERFVGLLYAAGSLVTILLFLLIPKILKKFGNYRTMFCLLLVDLISVLSLAWFQSYLAISAFFIINFVVIALIGFNLDVFLENLSSNSLTGKIRGTFLSASNIAWIIAPLTGSIILTDGDYWKIFLATAVLLLPVLFLLGKNFKKFRDPIYKIIPLKTTFWKIMRDKNVRTAFVVSFLLQFFYAWMVIYTPIYLYTYLNFSWREIGVMFSIMLLPFVITEAPLGRLADSRWGEKEVMSIGFIVMALTTGMIAFIPVKSFLLWTALLFASRIGASMVEVMSETYFFKKVNSDKTDIIGLFRTMRPFAYLLSPIIAMVFFSFGLPIKYIFIVLAFIMFFGLYSSLELEDTK